MLPKQLSSSFPLEPRPVAISRSKLVYACGISANLLNDTGLKLELEGETRTLTELFRMHFLSCCSDMRLKYVKRIKDADDKNIVFNGTCEQG